MVQRIDKLTAEQEAQLATWADKWIDIALRPGPTDRQAFEAAAEQCYRAAGHAWHGRVIWASSPYQMPPSLKAEAEDGDNKRHKMLDLSSTLHQRLVPSFEEWLDYQTRRLCRDIAAMRGSLRKSVEPVPPGKIDRTLSQHVERMTDAIVVGTLEAALFNPVQDSLIDGSVLWSSHWGWQFLLPIGTINFNHTHTLLEQPRLPSLSFYRDVCGAMTLLNDGSAGWAQAWSRHQAFETACTEALFWHPTKDYVVAYERPTAIHTERVNLRGWSDGAVRRRLHADHGPAMVFPDGWCIYAIHGVVISHKQRHIVEQPDTITVAEIEAEHNSEIRRIMIERYGAARFLADSGASVVHELPADHPSVGLRGARLLRKDMPRGEPVVCVDLLNSTPEPDGSVKRYMLRVDPNAYDGEASRNAHAAAASTWRHADSRLVFANWRDYRPVAES